ncbi:murein transglycosylase domain-containing protein [endosymbiont of Pachyrhynchus infernalis]|uniref:murein transglycosylase domain-containing protein n=1 Tax=endosymbiont of Pachyrhynchus infernalis TaxID=1971488 RepID=UPI000DC726B3|nr:murein transglycosylase domain-containing protein [endosymbiont of Pachyrhynchus infernalis]BBA84884.1 membrane-bound lytic murein transglycosylase C [endosymbiont of Pachyrhynchus infernalis]
MFFFILLIIKIFIINNYKNNYNLNSNDFYQIKNLIYQINNNIESIWGKNEIILVKNNNILKYYFDNKARIYVDFKLNKIIIETLLINNLNNIFKKILFNILNNNINFKFNNNVLKSEKLYIYKNILGKNKFPLLYKKDISNYIDFLVKNCINKRMSSKKNIIYIKIDIFNINNYKYNNYINIINKYSKKYNIDKSLILSIIHAESKFNPYAISNLEAIGLMQIIRNKSGLDVFKYKKKNNFPSVVYLINPKNNINVGVSYLYILKNKYFYNVKNTESIKYLIISSYNGGIKNVLNIFSLNFNDSINIINNKTSNELFNIILNNHPLKETRDYLIKVNSLYNFYKKNIK